MEKSSLKFFQTRRDNLFNQMEDNSLALVPSNSELIRNNDAHYSFRQDSNFYYLTGLKEPNSLAVLVKHNSTKQFILLVRPSDPLKEQWDGKMAGLDGAKDIYQADISYDINNKSDVLLELFKNKSKLYYSLGHNQEFDQYVTNLLQQVKNMQRRGVCAPNGIVNLDNILAELRLIKDDYEIEQLKKAAIVTAAGHAKAMQRVKQAEYEYELEAELRYEFCKHGMQRVAYVTIVGSGNNACVLHYIDNNQKIDRDSLVLIDAGAEHNYYAADITRTFPANGKFNTEQKAIYELVLSSQLAALEQVKPGNLWNSTQTVILEIITKGLVELGIIKNDNNQSIDELIDQEVYKPFYMHNSGHWLGLDVHDVGQYKQNNNWREFKPGMVLTVEPGIYIKQNMPGVDPKWWGIGVRIEDDVLVTKHGHEILTKDVPKQIHEVEQLVNGSNGQ